jgi:glucokinase
MSSTLPQERNTDWFAGVDVGGTSIKLGVVDSGGQVIWDDHLPTQPEAPPADAIRRIRACLHAGLEGRRDNVRAVGLGTPGPLDTRRGLILNPANLPGWRNYPVRDELAEALGRPVTFANDANAAAFGEFWIGRASENEHLVLLTLGTGVGSGIIVDGHLVTGAHDHAAECGHLSVEFGQQARVCSCGLRGHLEAYASASAVAARARELALDAPHSPLGRVLESAGDVTARDVYDCAQQHDPAARQVMKETAAWLARGIAAIAHTVDPDIVLLGGAMDFGGPSVLLGRQFLAEVDQQLRPQVFPQIARNLKIEFASLGGSSGWIGAAGLAKRDYDRST